MSGSNPDELELIELCTAAVSSGVRVAVRAKPRAKRTGLQDIRRTADGAAELCWGIGAAPVDGAANEELVRAVARFFGLPPSSVSIEAGATSASKRLVLGEARLSVVRERLRAEISRD